MTKVEAIKKVLEDNNGVATWNIIYNQLAAYYPTIKSPRDWKAAVRGVLYRDLGKSFKILDLGLVALMDYNEENLALKKDINDTSRSTEIKIRRGQNEFRKLLLKTLKSCPITGINEPRILVASHIKPWAVSSDTERLDVMNGFIFSPTIDKLFDTGLISFEDDTRLIVSPSLSRKNLELSGLEYGKTYPNLPKIGRLNYMNYHRNNVFVTD